MPTGYLKDFVEELGRVGDVVFKGRYRSPVLIVLGKTAELVGEPAGREKTMIAQSSPNVTQMALVDREGRIGALDTVFYDTLLDENAASHIAFGRAYGFSVDEPDRARANLSDIHIDFMIGDDDVEVDGITESGEEVPVLRGGAWQL